MYTPNVIYLSENPITNEPESDWLHTRCDNDDIAYFSEEHIREVVFAYLQGFSEFAQSTYGFNISAGTITDNIMRNLKGGKQ